MNLIGLAPFGISPCFAAFTEESAVSPDSSTIASNADLSAETIPASPAAISSTTVEKSVKSNGIFHFLSEVLYPDWEALQNDAYLQIMRDDLERIYSICDTIYVKLQSIFPLIQINNGNSETIEIRKLEWRSDFSMPLEDLPKRQNQTMPNYNYERQLEEHSLPAFYNPIPRSGKQLFKRFLPKFSSRYSISS
ncbi:hypothetical protein LSG31_05620 [Fodinisporobacter ferrooxydans]|uniref:Uncharacterized protein n=1 Tax=Fodinisporobacter ferrooxydans TaxID=2901836 RepID=A0ABY4CMK7_9BACL|nr:hypothetical protein LSG31_05620 [Alicyclobacillaceae bacterium MYW30-H2]